MTRLTVREYEPSDFMDIEWGEGNEYEIEDMLSEQIEKLAGFNKEAGPAFTVVDLDKRIVFIGGIHHIWPGLGGLWVVLSPLITRYLHARKLLQETLIRTFKTHGFRRIQIAVNIELEKVMILLEKLGFKRECIMECYGKHGETYAQYSLVRKEK